MSDLVLGIVCYGIGWVAFDDSLVSHDGFLSAALAFEEEADVVLCAGGELGVGGLLDDALEHFLGTFVGGEEFDAEDAAFFAVHVAFGDAVHGFDGVFKARTVWVFLEVFLEAFEGVVVFGESFEKGCEFESCGLGLGAEGGKLDDGAVGVCGFAGLFV